MVFGWGRTLSDYQVVWRDAYGSVIGIINAFSSIDLAYSERVVGGLSLVLPSKLYSHQDFAEDQILEVQRRMPGMDFYTERVFFLRSWTQDSVFLTLSGYDPIYLLTSRIIAYAANSAYTVKTGPADNVIKAFIRENLGSLAVYTVRTLTRLTVEADLSLGASVNIAASRNKLLETVQKIADTSIQKGTYISFDLEFTPPASFTFKTYKNQRGTDRGMTSGNSLVMSEKLGNLVNVTVKEDRADEVNKVYAGGTGKDADRIVAEAASAEISNTPWSRREAFSDHSNISDTSTLTDIASSDVRAGRPRKTMTGTVQQVVGCQYGVNYGFGDLVVMEGFGHSADARISTVHIQVDDKQNEQIDVRLNGEW